LTITSLFAHQAFAAVQLCGTTAKPYLFLKEVSSDGNIQTVDVLYPAMPIFLYSNPLLVKLLLDPLFENQESRQFPQTYAMHDLGANYPRVIRHLTGDGGKFFLNPDYVLTSTEYMPLEECGNMIITILAYTPTHPGRRPPFPTLQYPQTIDRVPRPRSAHPCEPTLHR
jgi:hypothetical protein